MSEKVRVRLLQQVQNMKDGKFTRYMPSNDGTKVSLIPASLYAEIKDKNPPVCELIVDSVVDEGEEISTEVKTWSKQPEAPKEFQPIKPIEFSNENSEDDTPTPPSIPVVPTGNTADKAVETLGKINGVGAALAKKLYDNGYETLQDVANASPEELQGIDGIHKQNVSGIISSAKGLI